MHVCVCRGVGGIVALHIIHACVCVCVCRGDSSLTYNTCMCVCRGVGGGGDSSLTYNTCMCVCVCVGGIVALHIIHACVCVCLHTPAEG